MPKDKHEHDAKDKFERPQVQALDTAPPQVEAQATITPSQWTEDTPESTTINAYSLNWGHHTPRKEWSIFSEDDNEIRYELRDGEQYKGQWPDGGDTERCEMGQNARMNTRGNTFTVDYEWLVEEGPPISSGWLTCGQLHSALNASPPCEIMFHNNDKMGVSANTGSSSNPKWQTAFQENVPIQRGHWYKMRLQLEPRQDGQGKVVLFRDGQKVCDFRGNVGYTDQTQTYWKQGVYRKSPANGETVVMRYRNLKITQGMTVPTVPDHGGGGGPDPEPDNKVVTVDITTPEGVYVEVNINGEPY